MSGSSTSMASIRRRRAVAAPYIPLVPCPDCSRPVKVFVSGTSEHAGWTFYKCKQHGNPCNFWHWEREYVTYLVENGVLRGDAAVDAVGWSEDRREELEIALETRKLEEWGRGAVACTRGGASSSNTMARGADEKMIKAATELLLLGRELVLFLKIAVALLSFIAIVVVAFFLKK